ncbi:MAG: DUF58 domain-containing protein [Myxococcales bacterium]|nr:DUF58 domain-containing protein [Myxococcales bacterium]
MLDERGLLIAGLVAALAAVGLLLDLPAALMVSAVLAALTLREIGRLRVSLRRSRMPWGLSARIVPPRVVASTLQLGRRSHRVGQELHLRLHVNVHRQFDAAWLQIDGFEATDGVDVEVRTVSARIHGSREFEFVVRSDTAAVHRLHGVRVTVVDPLGLVRAQLFLPCPYEVAVLPRSLPLDLRHLPETRRNVRRAAGGHRPDRVQGQGDELRELREHAPGDPFKHIAWKASARRGRLMSRVFEHERARSVYAVLDTGASMRNGVPGHTALDAGLDLLHSLAECSARRNLPFGMGLVDGALVDRQPVREGLGAVVGCDRALLDVRRTVAESLAPLPEDELLNVVASYLRAVQGVDLPQITGPESWVRFRQRTVMGALARLPERERLPALRGPEPSSRADLSILRRYCRAADLALPYRPALPASERVAGLISGIESALAARKGPFVIVLASDFLGLLGHCDPLWQTAARARSRGHRLILLSLVEPAVDAIDLVDDLEHVDTARGLAKADRAARAQLLDELQQGARRAGATLLADPQPRQIVRAWGAAAFG